MIKVGLTGNIGSGKTVIANIIKVLHVPVYNADESARHIMNTPAAVKKIIEIFGKEVLGTDRKPDRKKTAEIVFNDRLKLEKLNSLLHPVVLADFDKWVIRNKSSDYVVMESAILFETGYIKLFDKIIFVSAPESLRIKRVTARDRVKAAQVESRIKNQSSEDGKIKRSDFVIINDDQEPLIPQVLSIHKKIIAGM